MALFLSWIGLAQADDANAVAAFGEDDNVQPRPDRAVSDPARLFRMIVCLDPGRLPIEGAHRREIDTVLGPVRATLVLVLLITRAFRHISDCSRNLDATVHCRPAVTLAPPVRRSAAAAPSPSPS
jgi:hypothetical protein